MWIFGYVCLEIDGDGTSLPPQNPEAHAREAASQRVSLSPAIGKSIIHSSLPLLALIFDSSHLTKQHWP